MKKFLSLGKAEKIKKNDNSHGVPDIELFDIG